MKNLKMKEKLDNIDLYFITDRKLSKKTVLDDVKAAVKAGVKIVQYREKELSTKDMIKEALEIKGVCKDIIFLINDRIDVALGVDADGVHLGLDDVPYDIARNILGDKIIGVTVHNVEEALEAEKMRADYIGVSPIFHTDTKKDAGKPAGLKLIEDVKEAVNIPFVAIGGINLDNINGVVKAGAKSAAVISAIVCKDDVEGECRKFIGKIK